MSINIKTAYKSNITIPYGNLRSMIDWCKDNCLSDWQFEEDYSTAKIPHASTYKHYIMSRTYNFYFQSDRDYFAFTLWKK
jgi:hypothetical protein